MSGCDHRIICRFPIRSNSYRPLLTHLKILSASTLDDSGYRVPHIHSATHANSPIEPRRSPIQIQGQNKRNSRSRSPGSGKSTLVKDPKYAKLMLSKNVSNAQSTGIARLRMVLGLDYGTIFTAIAFAPGNGTLRDIQSITDWPGGTAMSRCLAK